MKSFDFINSETDHHLYAIEDVAVMKQVLIFKTNVQKMSNITLLKDGLDVLSNHAKWNFDFEDCDNILRVETDENISQKIIILMNQQGFECEELED